MLHAPYPPAPAEVSTTIMKPGPRYRKEVVRVALSILLFVIVYLILFAGAVTLTVLCAKLGLAIITASPGIYTLLFGLGCILLALMILYFLVKFLFASNKSDTSRFIELHEASQPSLFEFIRNITEETKTPFPKKIFLSPDVNASVFYNSGFWSMFLPVRKNLNIGLGLVNSTNLSEFKAVLAHEFGHFSQYSMKLGSYVYNVNRVIYNMLYNNEEYAETLGSISRIHGIIALFVSLVVWIVGRIQWLLRQVYMVINRSFMSLSREMEFHADAVSAAVSGGNQLVHALKGIEVAQVCYDSLFNYYNEIFRKNIKPDNIYPQHTAAMQSFCLYKGIAWNRFQPDTADHTLQGVDFSRITIKDQWASHPSLADREQHLDALHLTTETIAEPAWTIFQLPAALQIEMTEKIYSNVQFKSTPEILNEQEFHARYNEKIVSSSYNKLFKGFYDNRLIGPFDLNDQPVAADIKNISTAEELYSPERTMIPAKLSAIKNNIELLRLIIEKSIPARTFDFDGQKCRISQIPSVNMQLNIDMKKLEQELAVADKTVYWFFREKAIAAGKNDEIQEKYTAMFRLNTEHEEDIKLHNMAFKSLDWLYTNTLNSEQANIAVSTLKSNEVLVKKRIREMLENEQYAQLLDSDMKEPLDAFLTDGKIYLQAGGYNNEALQSFAAGLNVFLFLINRRLFMEKTNLFNWQLSLV